jgi:hypothetical protein
MNPSLSPYYHASVTLGPCIPLELSEPKIKHEEHHRHVLVKK